MKFKMSFKKVMAVLLTVALIFSCIAVSLTTFAATSAFRVTKSSPAVPLYVGKAVRTGNLSIEIGNATKLGNTLTWTRTSGTSAAYDASGYLVGTGAGKTCFTVSDGSNTQKVWVIVNGAGDSDFALIDLDFSTDFNASDWLEASTTFSDTVPMPSGNYKYTETDENGKLAEAGYISGKYAKTTGVISNKTVSVTGGGTRGALYIPSAINYGGIKAAVYKSEMMKDFADYTVESEMSNQMLSDNSESLYAAPGLLLRTDANYNAANGGYVLTGEKSLSLKFRNYGGVGIYGLRNSDRIDSNTPYENIPLWRQGTYTYYTQGKKADYFMCSDKSKVFYPTAKGANELSVKNVKIELNGECIKYTLNNNVIFNSIDNNTYSAFLMHTGSPATAQAVASGDVFEPVSSAANYTNQYNQNIKATSGTVGITNNYGNDLYVYSLKVTPKNINDQKSSLPEMLTVNMEYTMPVNTRVALKNIGVTTTDTSNTNYQIVDGNLLAFKVPTTNSGKVTFGGITIKFVSATSTGTINSTKFADSQMVITSNGNNSYTATVSSNEVIPGSLKVTEKTTKLVYGNDNANGKAFTFTVADPTDFVVTAQYATKANNLKKVEIMGASIRVPDATNKAEAIRFLSRVPAIKNSALYSDSSVTYKAAGTLIMPKSLLGSNTLKFPSTSTDPTTTKVITIGGYSARNVVFENLSQSTANYSDAWTTMYYGEQSVLDVLKEDMAAVSYVWYQTSGGTKGFYYSTQATKSYDDVYDAAFPINNNDTGLEEAVLYKNKYVSGNKTYFGAELGGAYSVSWVIKNASGSTVATSTSRATGTLAASASSTASGLYLEGTLYNDIAHSNVKYNSGAVAKFIINDYDNHESPDAPGGSATSFTIVDPNPITPGGGGGGQEDPEEPQEPEDPPAPIDPPSTGGTSPTRTTVIAGGDSLPTYLRTGFKVPTNLMSTTDYHTKLDNLRTSVSNSSVSAASSTFLKNLDNLDLMLQDSIVYDTNDLVNKTTYSKKYYVSSSSGNDNNSGTSPDKPWKTLKKVNQTAMSSGTLVSLKRGDTFRGILEPKSGVDYGAYGTGYKPIIMASYSTKANGWKWVQTNKTNIWKLDHKFTADNSSNYGCSFSNDLIHDLALSTLIDKNGNQYPVNKEKWICYLDDEHTGKTGRTEKNTHLQYEYCYTGTDYNYTKTDLDNGWAKSGDNYMYLYCTGNPNTLFDNAEIGFWSSCINEDNKYIHDVHINNLEMLYGTGAYWPGNCNHITVDYCIAGWQGGYRDKGAHDDTPYTGGMGVTGACDSLIFDHCYIFQQWDSGVSAQNKWKSGDAYGGSGVTSYKDFITTNCLFKGTKWTLEVWLQVNDTTEDKIDHMVFDYNIVRDTGWGFNCYQQWESGIFETWGYANEYINNCSVQHNVFDRPYERIYRIGGFKQSTGNVYTFGAEYFPTIDYNILIQKSGTAFALIKRKCDKNYTSDQTLAFNATGMNLLRNTYGCDKHSLFVTATR